MNRTLSVYVAFAATAGAAALVHSLVNWQCASAPALLAYFALALAASAIKLRLPGLPGTVSLGFVAVLDGVALMSASETVIVVTAAALMQQVWNAAQRPQPVQMLFNASLLAASTWVAYHAAHVLAPGLGSLQIVVAVGPLYLLNAAAVAGVMSIVSTGGLQDIWRKFQFTVFPFYLVGALLAVLIGQARLAHSGTPILVPLIALTYLTFNSYRSLMERHA